MKSKTDFIFFLVCVLAVMLAGFAAGHLSNQSHVFQSGVYCGVLATQREALGRIDCGDSEFADCMMEEATRIRAEYFKR